MLNKLSHTVLFPVTTGWNEWAVFYITLIAASNVSGMFLLQCYMINRFLLVNLVNLFVIFNPH